MNQPSDKKQWMIVFTAIGLFLAAFIVAKIFIEDKSLGPSLRVILAMLPVPPFAWMLWRFIKGITSLDELQKKIQLEALAIAYPVMMLFLMTIGLLDQAVGLSYENFGVKHLWYYMPMFYFCGLFVASRRYQ